MAFRVVVTNDDGIDSPGLAVLARCALDLGWETVVAAPSAESSGTSAGLTAAGDSREIAVDRRTLPAVGAPAYAVAAHPGLIALAACHDGFGPRPDLVLSGVNRGGNVGRAVLHSGTVGAALTAGINGTRAVAVSLDVPFGPEASPHWDVAATAVPAVLRFAASCETGTVLNVNVPDIEEPGPARWARLASFGRVRTTVTHMSDGAIEVSGVEVPGELEAGTDAALLADGHVTVTALRSVHEDTELMARELP
jgi:5'-nucleotidase